MELPWVALAPTDGHVALPYSVRPAKPVAGHHKPRTNSRSGFDAHLHTNRTQSCGNQRSAARKHGTFTPQSTEQDVHDHLHPLGVYKYLSPRNHHSVYNKDTICRERLRRCPKTEALAPTTLGDFSELVAKDHRRWPTPGWPTHTNSVPVGQVAM